jgi:hypothetical protein
MHAHKPLRPKEDSNDLKKIIITWIGKEFLFSLILSIIGNILQFAGPLLTK